MAKKDLQLEKLPVGEWDEWDPFVRQSPQGTVFQESRYLQSFADVFHRELNVMVIRQDQEILAGLVLLPKKRGWIRYATSHYLLPYNGPLISEDLSGLSYQKKIKWINRIIPMFLKYIRENYQFAEMYLSDQIPDLREFIWRDWRIIPDYTIQIPLEDLSINQLPHNQRRHLNKFSQYDTQFSESSDYASCFDLMNSSYENHSRTPPISKTQFMEFTSLLTDQNLLRTYTIARHGRIMAFIMVAECAPTVYALFSGKDFTGNLKEAELYLHWKTMEYYAGKGFRSLDLLGAMMPSISRVKLELGGILRRGDHARYFKNRFYNALYWLQQGRQERNRRLT